MTDKSTPGRVFRKARRALTPGWVRRSRFKRIYFADTPVDIEAISHFRKESFPDSGPYPWLDLPDAEQQIARKLAAHHLTAYEAEMCRKWVQDGYIIIKNPFREELLDRAWKDYEAAVENGIAKPVPDFNSPPDDIHLGRTGNPHLLVPSLGEIFEHGEVQKWVQLLMGRDPMPFQTIISSTGTQQGVHSDSIHMTTYPMGYLTAAWVAFEDIHPDSGPLVFFPGSHRLPYQLSQDAGLGPTEFREHGYAIYREKYEPFVRRIIEEKGLKPDYFLAKKGDVLVWHANLLHGGSKRKDFKHSRRALVSHYFVKGAFCYHDLWALTADQSRKPSTYL